MTREFIWKVNRKVAKMRSGSGWSAERQELQGSQQLKTATDLMTVVERNTEEVKEEGRPGSQLRHRKSKPRPADPSKPALSLLISLSLYSEFTLWLARSNGLAPLPNDSSYKYYVGPGNNNQLIAFLMKKRWFWTRVDSWQQADFIWTQHKLSVISEKLEGFRGDLTVVEPDATQPKLPFQKPGFRAAYTTERAKTGISLITSSPSYTWVHPSLPSDDPCFKLYNRFDKNYQLTSKKRLFLNMKSYYEGSGRDVFANLPLTFLIQDGLNDPQMRQFESYFEENSAKKGNLWIVKPGENSNCGLGIHVLGELEEIRRAVSCTRTVTGRSRSYIVQKYLEKPLLVNRRKFDIRCYALVTGINGHIQGYFYHEGYLRTSSKEYTLKNLSNRFIHLTNDAVQKKSDDYGRFENGNKLSYIEFHRYLQSNFPNQVDFYAQIWPEIRRLVTDSLLATYRFLDPVRRKHSFEILGYDFMIDEQFKVWLIEVNTNPCLELSSAYLARLIPNMLENAFRIAVDPYFLEPVGRKRGKEWAAQAIENKFELVFSSVKDWVDRKEGVGETAGEVHYPSSPSCVSSDSEEPN